MSVFEQWFKSAVLAGTVVLLAACSTTPPEDEPVVIPGETIVPVPEERPTTVPAQAAYPLVDGAVRFARVSHCADSLVFCVGKSHSKKIEN